VFNEKMQLVQGATVNFGMYGLSPDGKSYIGGFPTATTDAHGRFLMERLPWGRIVVGAGKVSARYARGYDATFFYGANRVPVASLSQEAPRANVVIKIGPKAGILRGSVINSYDRSAVPAAGATIQFVHEPNRWISKGPGPRFELMVPPDALLRITFAAEGFLPWTDTVQLRAGEIRDLTVALRPSH